MTRMLFRHDGLFALLSFSLIACAFASFSQQIVLEPDREAKADHGIHFNFSSPAPHIFSSLNSILQQWPNSFFPNGHSIVPCEIPAYTALYHGRPDDSLPPSPEFLAFDIEMAYSIMGNARESHMMTFQTNRPIKCLYFDGQSATLMGNGMNSQMVFIYGNVSGPDREFNGILGDEYDRASRLCDWAKTNGLGGLGWGVEGIIRMNAGFEMIWCNFSSPSLRLISHLNVTAPLLPIKRDSSRSDKVVGPDQAETNEYPTQSLFPLPTTTIADHNPTASGPPEFQLPENWRDLLQREPYLYAAQLEWLRSATWRYGNTGAGLGKGEFRPKPLTCGFLSYYNPQFTTRAHAISSTEQDYLNLTSDGLWQGPGSNGTMAVALLQLERRRRYHNLWTFDEREAKLMNDDAKEALENLNNAGSSCTGLDWVSLTDEIVLRYSEPLTEFREFLQQFYDLVETANRSNIRNSLFVARVRSHALLLPFLEYPQTDLLEGTDSYSEWLNKTFILDSPLGQSTYSRCRYRYTRLLALDQPITINPQETLILQSIEEVLSSICATIITIGFSIERLWLSDFNSIALSSSRYTAKSDISSSLPSFLPEIRSWNTTISLLFAYLGWTPLTTTCAQKCAWDEVCHIPIWPLPNLSPSNSTGNPPWDHYGPPGKGRNGTFPPYGRGPGYGYGGHGPGGPPPWGNRNSSLGHGGMDNLPPPRGGFGGSSEDLLWEPRCAKLLDVNRLL